MSKKETITLSEEQTKELKEKGEVTVEIEDVDLGNTEGDIEKVKKEAKGKVIAQHVLNKEQQKLYEEALKAAELPVKFTDDDFKLGKNELDVRDLSSRNRTQMLFRTLVLLVVNSKECFTTLLDISRLLMIICDKLGIEDIVKATDDIIEKVDGQQKIKAKLKREKKFKKAAKTDA